jgi:hypothetical protein
LIVLFSLSSMMRERKRLQEEYLPSYLYLPCMIDYDRLHTTMYVRTTSSYYYLAMYTYV